MAEKLECPQSAVRPLCPTRFTMKARALEGTYSQLNILGEALTQIDVESGDYKLCSRATGFRNKLVEFEFYFSLTVSLKLFEITDRLSTELQMKNISAGAGGSLLCLPSNNCSTIAVIRSLQKYGKVHVTKLWN